MSEHTPTPWYVDGLYVSTHQPLSVGASIADCGKSSILTGREKAANAAFIVRAVNSYESLQSEITRLRVCLGNVKLHASAPNRYPSERLDNIERICDEGLK